MDKQMILHTDGQPQQSTAKWMDSNEKYECKRQ